MIASYFIKNKSTPHNGITIHTVESISDLPKMSDLREEPIALISILRNNNVKVFKNITTKKLSLALYKDPTICAGKISAECIAYCGIDRNNNKITVLIKGFDLYKKVVSENLTYVDELNKNKTVEEKIHEFLHKGNFYRESIEKFNWNKYSSLVVKHCPQFFDAEKYNWSHIKQLLLHSPENFDSDKFDWEKNSMMLLELAPQLFDKDKFNWKKHSRDIIREYPQFFDNDRFEWERYSGLLINLHPELFDPEKFNWDKYSYSLLNSAPELLDLEKASLRNIKNELIEKITLPKYNVSDEMLEFSKKIIEIENTNLEEFKAKALLGKL